MSGGVLAREVSVRVRSLALALLALLLVAPGVDAQRSRRDATPRGVVAGIIVDRETGNPIAGVEVGVRGVGPLSVTNEDGEFRIDPFLAGTRVLWARRLGYQEREDSLVVVGGALLHLRMEMSTEAIELDALVVDARSAVLDRRGFYTRQKQGYGGTFINPDDIKQRNPAAVTDLFRTVPGIRVVYGGIYGAGVFVNQRVTFQDSNMPGCRPSIWIDGARSNMYSFDEMRVEEIEGMEVYTGATAPGKYNDICGTVAIWTKVPIR